MLKGILTWTMYSRGTWEEEEEEEEEESRLALVAILVVDGA